MRDEESRNATIVCGSPGAGKSTYGKILAKKLQAAFIDIDTATERLVRLSLSLSGHDPDDRDSTFFKNNFRQPVYDQLFDIARENLTQIDVVIAGPFTKELRDTKWPEKLESLLKASVEIHYIYCNPDVRKKRMLQRANPRDTGKFANWHTLNTYYDDEKPPLFKHILVDNSKELEKITEEVRTGIRKKLT
ncbi:MAG: ATP-binding protein [Deltaproteobacteria bacterium]|nr:MAG: ATP-binding protein [Deltaproteobacteria bacterium]